MVTSVHIQLTQQPKFILQMARQNIVYIGSVDYLKSVRCRTNQWMHLAVYLYNTITADIRSGSVIVTGNVVGNYS